MGMLQAIQAAVKQNWEFTINGYGESLHIVAVKQSPITDPKTRIIASRLIGNFELSQAADADDMVGTSISRMTDELPKTS